MDYRPPAPGACNPAPSAVSGCCIPPAIAPSTPSLPAGIIKDDSDHCGARRGRVTSRRSWGRKGPRFYLGGHYRPPRFLWIGTGEADYRGITMED